MLQKCSLTQVTILHSLWNCKNCIKMGKTQKGVVWEAKHKSFMFGIITQSWLSNMWCAARLGTICTIYKEFYHYITILPLYYQYCYYKILRLCVSGLYYCYVNSQFTILQVLLEQINTNITTMIKNIILLFTEIIILLLLKNYYYYSTINYYYY